MGGELSRLGRVAASSANASNSHLQAGALPQPSSEGVVDRQVTMMNDASIRAMDVLRPYLLLACVAFTIGFVGYWVLGGAIAPPGAAEERWDARVSAPLPAPGDWNPPKRI